LANKREKQIAGLVVIVSLLLGALPTRAQNEVKTSQRPPITALAAVILPGVKTSPAHFGVYLGAGVVLTNWHPWTLDGREYTSDQPALPPSRQAPGYDADEVDDPGENMLSLADCGSVWADSPGADAGCIPFAWTEGAGVIFPAAGDTLESQPVPILGLIYANRQYDIALLAVDAQTVEQRSVRPARLSGAPTRAGHAVIAGIPGADLRPIPTPAALPNGTPTLLPPTEGYSLVGPWRVPSLTVDMPDLPDGTPVFDSKSGDLIGLVWRGSGSKTQPESWITPAAVWLSALYAASDEVQRDDLRAVLDTAQTVPLDGTLTMHDPLAPELGSAAIDVQHYTLDLAFDLDAQTISGTAALTVRVIDPQLMTFGLDATGLQIEQVTVDGQDAPFVAKEHKLIIQLPAPLSYGTIFETAISYRVQPQPFTSRYMPYLSIGVFFDGNRVSMLNQPDGAHTWFPCNDHPADRATYDFFVRIPDGLQAVANGVPEADVLNADATHTQHWQMDQPMATYLVTIAIGDYAAVEEITPGGMPITHYIYADRLDDGQNVFSYTGAALVLLQDLFGPYPYDQYGHVVVPRVGMALETQTLSTMPDSLLDGTEEAAFPLVVHELAHQWYGNSVSLQSWMDIWLNEGFATYAEWLAREQRFGAESAWAARDYSERQLITDQRTTPLAAPQPGDMFSPASYDKGAWLLHMLRGQIGDDAFWALLRQYADTFSTRPVDSVDFWRLAEEVSGQDLAWFFDQWLLRGGLPRYTLYWSGGDVLLCAHQPDLYQIDLPVRFIATEFTHHDMVLTVRKAETRASVPLSFFPGEVVADPDQTVLAQVQVQPIETLPEGCPAVE
jgi:hypothetical protein